MAQTAGMASKLSVAPMMDWTDRHCRVFHRLLAPRSKLYTEMVTTGALLHGDVARHLEHSPQEHPLALQLGGSDPKELAQAVALAEAYRFDEINLNVGCPSPRVQKGAFGACLMAEPELVRDCCAAMTEQANVPVTVKTRIGIDDSDGYRFFRRFVDCVAQAGVNCFIIHARKAWLQGLSPKQNRDIPPLDYEQAYRLKRERPDLTVILNGGITKPSEALAHIAHVDGVMIGRQAYQEPMSLPAFERALFGDCQIEDPLQALTRFLAYVDAERAKGTPLKAMARHTLGLFNGRPGARRFRRLLSEGMTGPKAGVELYQQAIGHFLEPVAASF